MRSFYFDSFFLFFNESETCVNVDFTCGFLEIQFVLVVSKTYRRRPSVSSTRLAHSFDFMYANYFWDFSALVPEIILKMVFVILKDIPDAIKEISGKLLQSTFCT